MVILASPKTEGHLRLASTSPARSRLHLAMKLGDRRRGVRFVKKGDSAPAHAYLDPDANRAIQT